MADVVHQFLETELKANFEAAIAAATSYELGKRDRAARALAVAEVGYATLLRYLSDRMYAAHVTGEQRNRLQSGLERLFEVLRILKNASGTSTLRDAVLTALSRPVAAEQRWSTQDNPAVAELAYQFWLERGCPVGSPEADWFRAEAVLRASDRSQAA